MIYRNIFDHPALLQDLAEIPQDSRILNNAITSGLGHQASYIKDFFLIWQYDISNFSNICLADEYHIGQYKENFALSDQYWYSHMIEKSNLLQLGTLDKKAIITSNSSLRKLPTMNPSYHNPLLPGEGYPFDNIQENLLRIGEPVLISHYSTDKDFAFIITNAKSYGFVPSQDVAIIDNALSEEILSHEFKIIIKDNSFAYYKDNYIATLDFGAFLPTKNQYIMLPIRNIDGSAGLLEVSINQNHISHILDFNVDNIKFVVNELINKPYGWGGYLHNRDCAQLVKDYFAVFGKHIPIFSAEQIKSGKHIELTGDKDNKLNLIKTLPPFQTILYRKGHIVIYVGEYCGHPIIFQSIWGVKLYDAKEQEYRYIIGKSVITSLEFGKELQGFDQDKSSFLSSITQASVIE